VADLVEANGVRDQGQPIEWQPMGQRNILVWEVLICMVWQSADDDIADESERAVLDLNKILAIPL